MTTASDIFAVPLQDSWVVVAPLHGLSARVNQRTVAAIASGGGVRKHGALEPLTELFDAPATPAPEPRRGPISPLFLGLVTTRACNMNCGYCNFGARVASGHQMEPSVAVTAIDWMAGIAAREGRPALDVHLFGGEPFLADDLIDIIVHRTRIASAAKGLEPVLEASTNGAYSAARARFAGEYFKSIVLSLDGPAAIHDLHRPFRDGSASFEMVQRTARILSNAPAELNLRVCVSQLNVGSMPSIAAWMAKEFRPSMIDFEPLRPNADAERAGLFAPDPYQFAEAYLETSRVALELGVTVTYSAAVCKRARLCFCPLGHDAVIVEADGKLHSCYLDRREWEARSLDLQIGEVVAGQGMKLDEHSVARVRGIAVPPAKCYGCFCRYWCAGGCRVSESGSDAFSHGDFCIQTRLITLGLLLHQLGEGEASAALLSDRSAAQKLALRISDRIGDWERAL